MIARTHDVLLVGSDGYIGSNCPFDCDKADIESGNDFLKLEPKEYDTIIFLASKLESTKEAVLYNEELYAALDAWVNKFPLTHVIYSSSAAVYGEGVISWKEFDYPIPINGYGHSKLSGEYHVREYQLHTVLRFGNVYGKLEGKDGHGVTEKFKSGSIIINGDGEQVRDFVPIETIWKVIDMAVEHVGNWQGVFNVSMSTPMTINEWYKLHGFGKPMHVEPRPGDIRVSKLNNLKMKRSIELCRSTSI